MLRTLLVLLLLQNCYSQNNIGKLSSKEQKHFAGNIISVNLKYSKLTALKNFFQRDSVIVEGGSVNSLFSFLDPNYQIEEGYEAPDNIKLENIEQSLNANYKVFLGYEQFVSHPNLYVIAIKNSGKFYYLRGFEKKEFDLFIQDVFRNNTISNEDAFKIASLYLMSNAQQNSYEEIKIIDNSTIDEFKSNLIKLPSIKKENEKIIINIYFVILPDKIMHSKMQISESGIITIFSTDALN